MPVFNISITKNAITDQEYNIRPGFVFSIQGRKNDECFFNFELSNLKSSEICLTDNNKIHSTLAEVTHALLDCDSVEVAIKKKNLIVEAKFKREDKLLQQLSRELSDWSNSLILVRKPKKQLLPEYQERDKKILREYEERNDTLRDDF